jgi:hypothetical protein
MITCILLYFILKSANTKISNLLLLKKKTIQKTLYQQNVKKKKLSSLTLFNMTITERICAEKQT